MESLYFVYSAYSFNNFIVKLLLPLNLYCYHFLHFEKSMYSRDKKLVEVYVYSAFVPSLHGQGKLCLKNKDQLDATYHLIVLLIDSTCFVHYCARNTLNL